MDNGATTIYLLTEKSCALPTALQERLTTNAQRTKKYFSFSCAPFSTLHIYYITKFEKCQIFKMKIEKFELSTLAS